MPWNEDEKSQSHHAVLGVVVSVGSQGFEKKICEGAHGRSTPYHEYPSPGCYGQLCILCNYAATSLAVVSLSSAQSLYYGYSSCTTNLNMLLPCFQRSIPFLDPQMGSKLFMGINYGYRPAAPF